MGLEVMLLFAALFAVVCAALWVATEGDPGFTPVRLAGLWIACFVGLGLAAWGT